MKKRVRLKDIAKPADVLCPIEPADLAPLPGCETKAFGPLKPDWPEKYDFSLDGFSALALPKPADKEEEDAMAARFLQGLELLFSRENNWTFLQPILLSTDYCVRCNTCNEACPIYVESGRQDIYRPNYRSELLRKIYQRYFTPEGRLLGGFVGADVELNWRTLNRLAELRSLGCPILLGASRKRFIGAALGGLPPGDRAEGTAATVAAGIMRGANIIRVHDVKEMARVARMTDAIMREEMPNG